jgi:hypothetical protein
MPKLFQMLVVVAVCGCERTPPPEPAPEPAPAPAATPAPTDEELAADAILRFVLTAKELESTREFYGTAGHKEVILLAGPWPECEYSALAGYTLHRKEHQGLKGPDKVKTLGVRIDKFDLHHKPTGRLVFDTGIVISVENAGGSKNGWVMGGCTVYLSPRKVDGRWVVDCHGLVDD